MIIPREERDREGRGCIVAKDAGVAGQGRGKTWSRGRCQMRPEESRRKQNSTRARSRNRSVAQEEREDTN